MNLWTWGDTHFLLSDNSNHLLSGFHAHGGGQSTMKPQKNNQAEKEERLLMDIVRAYVRNIV